MTGSTTFYDTTGAATVARGSATFFDTTGAAIVATGGTTFYDVGGPPVTGLIRNNQVTIRDVAADRLLRYPVEILATRTGMDLTQTMDYEIYIVPDDNTLIPVGIIFEATAASGVTVAPVVSLGIGSGTDEIFATEGLVDFNVIGEVWSNWILAASQAVPQNTSINLSVTGGTASTLAASFYLVGFLV